MQLIVQKKGHRVLPLLLLAVAMAVLVFIARDTQAVHDDGLFELDVEVPGASPPCPTTNQGVPITPCSNANTVDDSGAGAPYDWETICKATNLTTNRTITLVTPKPTGVSQASCDPDWALPDHTTFATGSKDIGDIAPGGFVGSGTWACSTDNNVLEKDEIQNAYAALTKNPGDQHDQLYFGLERPSNNGTSFMGFWFLQAEVSCTAPNNGSSNWVGGRHVPGDVLILSDFSGGGRVSTVRVLQWNPNNILGLSQCTPGAPPGGSGNLVPDVNVGPLCEITQPGQDCSVASSSDTVCGAVNAETVTTPWWNQPNTPPCKPSKGGVQAASGTIAPCTVPMASNQLYEGGIDLTSTLCPGGTLCALPCFSTFLAETRSSDEETADLKDYTGGSFEVCGKATIIKQTDPANATGTFTYDSTLPCGDFSLTDADSTPAVGEVGVHRCDDLNPNTYYVTENNPTALTPPFDLVNIVCTVDNNPDGATSVVIGKFVDDVFGAGLTNGYDASQGEDTVKITIGTLGEVTCTYTNRQRGTILIKKVDEAGNPLAGACFSITPNPKSPAMVGDVCDKTASDAGSNDTDARPGFLCVDSVLLGNTYTVHESVVPTGYEGADDQTIAVNTVDTCAQRQAAGGAAVLVFENKLGSIFIKKVVDKAGNPLLGGACFTIAPDGTTGTGTFTGTVCDNNVDNIPGPGAPDLTDSDTTLGEICVDDVPLDDYDITESIVPANFLGDTPKDVTVSNSDDCAALTAIVFKNVPLSKFQIKFFDLTGFTDAAIDCSNANEVSENGGADTLTITGNTAANPTVVTTSGAHDLVDGAKVQITGSNSTPLIDGTFVVDALTANTFTIPVNVTAAGNAGTVVAFDDTDETFGNGTTGLVPGLYSCTINVDP